jgi:hypothetical protein
MVNNYREIGRNPFILPEHKKGVKVMNSLARSLKKQGLLPERFPESSQQEPLKKGSPSILKIMSPDQYEESWQKEIGDLVHYTKEIEEAIFDKNKDVLKGFDSLLFSLSKQASRMGRNSDFSIDEVLKIFQESSSAYEKSTRRPNHRKESGKVMIYHKANVLTPRDMRIIFFSYGLLPNQIKSLEELNKEEETSTAREIRERAELHIVWHLRPRDYEV